MKLYHATPRKNIDSIKATGIDPDYSTGKIVAVWLHTKSRREWAVLHTQRRHNVGASDIVIIEVEVPREDLRRRYKGIWSTANVVTNFKSIMSADELSVSPITGN